ncbi:MAG: hypothetical protein R2774_13990 [Saprospiraceae bacterium]
MRRISIVILLLALGYFSRACDVCGCTSGTQFLGVLPFYQKHLLGIRYLHKSFDIYHPKIFIDDIETNSKDVLTQVDLWYRFQWNTRFQLLTFVPYRSYYQKEHTNIFTNSGLGDISILGNVTFLDAYTNNNVRHTLLFGAGIKLPTGANNTMQNGVLLSQFKQMGSGSVDIPMQMQWFVRKSNFGLKLEGQYKYNMTNSDGYKYGNNLSSAADIIFWKESADWKIIPQIGLAYESVAKDHNNGFPVALTGVEALYGRASIDMYYRKIGIGISLQVPISQSQGDGYIVENLRTNARLLYLF